MHPGPHTRSHLQLGVVCRDLLWHLAARLEVRHRDVVLSMVVVVQELEVRGQEARGGGSLRPRERAPRAQLRPEAAQHLLQGCQVGAQRIVRTVPAVAGRAGDAEGQTA